MIDLNSLKNIDFKNFDFQKNVVPLLLQNRNLLGQVIVIGLTLLILLFLANYYRAQSVEYSTQTGELTKKVEAIEDYESELKKMKKFKESVPKALDQDGLSGQIVDLATQNNITILNFTPGQKVSKDFIEITRFGMSIQANDFKDFLLFLKAIEDSIYSLRIDACSTKAEPSKSEEGNNEHRMWAQIEISSVAVKE